VRKQPTLKTYAIWALAAVGAFFGGKFLYDKYKKK
jgi:hypothetical protein